MTADMNQKHSQGQTPQILASLIPLGSSKYFDTSKKKNDIQHLFCFPPSREQHITLSFLSSRQRNVSVGCSLGGFVVAP